MPLGEAILYIDDNVDWTKIFTERMPVTARVLTASSVAVAIRQFNAVQDLSMIVIAGGGEVFFLITFVMTIRSRWHGTIIAGHSDLGVNRVLMDAGCNIMVNDKSNLAALAIRCLNDDAASPHRRRN